MKKVLLVLLGIFSGLITPLFSQLTNDQYQKALWMVTRMYGGQRSGYGPNWIIMDHNVSNNGKVRNGVDFINDSDGSYDLTGGWHDCGDHVKFGQTQFYSAYVLLLGFEAFQTGYGDYYSHDYTGYSNSSDLSWEGQSGYKNYIPDILDEIKYATDFFIKCAKDDNTFYSQVGNGNYDHKQWVTSAYMSTLSQSNGGENRPILKNPNDAAMASFCGASLAAMSRHYRKYDATYADLCLVHARHAYAYAKSKKSKSGGTITGSFYSPDNEWKDNYVCLCAEMYWATGETSFLSEALSYTTQINDQWWVLDFENSQDLAFYNLMRLGNSLAATKFTSIVNYYKGKINGEGLLVAGGTWGRLRYCANAAFVVALHQAYNNESTFSPGVIGTAEYILGENSQNQSFVVGFGPKAPIHPHHRNIFLNDNNASNVNALPIPARNAQHGFMIGGTDNPSSFIDDVSNYSTSEGCIDYQAGFVGLLAYINSQNAPYDTTAFTPLDDVTLTSIDILPNPVVDNFEVSLNTLMDIYAIKIYAMDGREEVVVLLSKDEEVIKIDASNISSGIYIIQIEGSKGVIAKTLIKN